MGDVQDKSDAYAALESGEVEDYLQELLSDKPDEMPLTCDCQE